MSPLEPPSHLPLHPTTLGCHRVLGLSSLHVGQLVISFCVDLEVAFLFA